MACKKSKQIRGRICLYFDGVTENKIHKTNVGLMLIHHRRLAFATHNKYSYFFNLRASL